MKPEIAFVGAAHIDRLGKLASVSVSGKSNPGQFAQYAGGASLNVASVFQQLGSSSTLVSILGRDQEAQFVREVCQSRGLRFMNQNVGRRSTASYTSIVEPDGELHIALADMEIYEHFALNQIDGLQQFLENCACICVDANLPEQQIEKLLDSTSGKRVGLTVSAAKAGRLENILPKLDILFTNKAEAAALLKQQSNCAEMVRQLSELGPATVVMSDGPNAIHFCDHDDCDHLDLPSPPAIVDVTGAGDALVAGCLYSLTKGEPLVEAVEFGARAAQKVLEVEGPWRNDMASLLDG